VVLVAAPTLVVVVVLAVIGHRWWVKVLAAARRLKLSQVLPLPLLTRSRWVLVVLLVAVTQ